MITTTDYAYKSSLIDSLTTYTMTLSALTTPVPTRNGRSGTPQTCGVHTLQKLM